MQYYISQGEAQYMDINQGHFSKALAEWAIGNMKVKKPNGEMKKIAPMQLDVVEKVLENNGVRVEDCCIYDAWYLYNMCLADYKKSLPTEQKISEFIDETINDPDCVPEAVLACFRAKMDTMHVPIHWERYL